MENLTLRKIKHGNYGRACNYVFPQQTAGPKLTHGGIQTQKQVSENKNYKSRCESVIIISFLYFSSWFSH